MTLYMTLSVWPTYTITGLTKGEEGGPDSHGFCFLNNISIGAAYAMNKYRESIRRVAIVDFDVHHGNGTEETVRWLKPGVDTEEHFTDRYVYVYNDICV